MTENTDPRPSVVVLGGGYGGINVAKALDEVAEVTLVDPKAAFVHNVAAWRALVEPEWLERIFLPYDRLLANGSFIRDHAVEVDGRSVKLSSGERLEPDYLILATGSSYPFPAKSTEPDVALARTHYLEAHEALRAAGRVLVVGAGPSGLELSGEIKAFFPEKEVTVADVSNDIMAGPFDQALRDELRRQLDALGVRLALGSPLRELPAAPPDTLAPISIETEAGLQLTADIWFRCFGVTPQTGYLRGRLADARGAGGYIAVDQHLRVVGQPGVFALGDAADADRDMAGMASAQAKVVAANVSALVTGEGELTSYERYPTVIAVPLGPEGGAGQLPGQDAIAGPEAIAELKGRHMLMDSYVELFNAAATA